MNFIGNAAVVLTALLFLAGPHNEAVGGTFALLLFVAIVATMAVHVVDCVRFCCSRQAVRTQIYLYLFALPPIVVMAVAMNLVASMYLFVLWVFGLAVLAIWRWVAPIGALDKGVDKFLSNGFIAG